MGKTLRADIIVGGKADSSFYQLGNTLENLGQTVNQISEKLIQFGKESVEAYTSYEDYMLDAEVALRTQYDSTNELSKAMEQLDKAAMQWARDSRFTTEDVAGAISNAAHAGWDLQKILTGVPSAMKISLAGGMELAEGLEYLVDISNAAGVGFDELGTLVDYWAYAANRSSTTIPEMGAAMQKMGATMQFAKGDMAGLVTMLGVLANNGAKGTEAGTLLRNSFIRLVAPTKKAAEAMGDLSLSGEDLDDIYSNTAGLEEAAQMLEEAGFSAYDSQGRLKSFMTIWQELDEATAGMSEQDRNNILTAIFPTRTITGAMALLEAASKDWDGLYSSILKNGEGYADYASEKMESGLGGTLRHLESVYNALQTRTGESLSEDVATSANALSGMIDAVNGLDSGTFDSIVAGLEAIAVAGPGLMAAGAAFKFFGLMLGAGGPVTALGLWAVGLTAAAVGIEKFNKAVYESQFGELSVNTDAIGEYLNVIGGDFNGAAEKISGYNSAVAEALQTYQELASGMKSEMVTDYITKATLTKEQIDNYYNVGEQMMDAVKAGIEGNYSAAMEIIGYLADADPTEVIGGEDSVASSIMELLSDGYEDAIEKAEDMGARLREAMTSAFADGQLTDDEITNISGIYNQINALMEQQENAALRAKYDVSLDKAMALGKEGADQVAKLANEWYSSAEEEAYSWKEQTYAALYNSSGGADLTADQRAWIDQGFSEKMAQARSDANGIIMSYWDRMAAESDLSQAYSGASDIAEALLSGYVTPYLAHEMYRDRYGNNQYADEFDNPVNGENIGTQLSRMLSETIAALGGQRAVEEQIDFLERTGQAEQARTLQRLYAMEQIANDYAVSGVSDGIMGVGGGVYTRRDIEYSAHKSSFLDAVDSYEAQMGDGLRYAAGLLEKDETIRDYLESIGKIANGNDQGWVDTIYGTAGSTERNAAAIIGALKTEYDFDAILGDSGIDFSNSAIGEEFAAWRILLDETFNGEAYKLRVTPEIDEGGLAELGSAAVPVDIVPREDGMGLSDLENQGVTVDVEGDTTTLSATIDAEDGQTLLEYVDGDAENLSLTITDQDGRVLVENVTGNTAALASAINAYNGKVVTVTVNYKSSGFAPTGRLYAEGGRATEPSIFGEVPGVAEWAIPEQHTQRTAELLDAAREASGFTWPDLIGRNGDLSTAAKGNWTLVYSPVIHAANADGVEQKLRDDKNRLEKWLRDKQLHDEMEVYS